MDVVRMPSKARLAESKIDYVAKVCTHVQYTDPRPARTDVSLLTQCAVEAGRQPGLACDLPTPFPNASATRDRII